MIQGSPEQYAGARRDTNNSKKNSTMNTATNASGSHSTTAQVQGQKTKHHSHLNQSNIAVSRQKIQSFGSADKRQNQKHHDLSLNSNKLMGEGPHHLQSLKLQQLNSNNLSMEHQYSSAQQQQHQEHLLNSSAQNVRVLPGHIQAANKQQSGKTAGQQASKSKERKNRQQPQAQQQYIVQSNKIPQAYVQGKLINMNPAFIAQMESNNQQQNNSTALNSSGLQQQFSAGNQQQKQQQLHQQFFEEMGGGAPDTIDFDVNMSHMQSPEYSNGGDINSKAMASRKRQIDAMNIKKTQSMKRMMLEKQDSGGMSPTSQAALHMHNSIALLNQSNSGGRQSQLVNSANFIDQSIMHYYQTGHASSQPRGSKKTSIKHQTGGHSKQLASANRAQAAQRGNQSAKAGTIQMVPQQQNQQPAASVNQRKNRNLYTSIGNYNTSNAGQKAAMMQLPLTSGTVTALAHNGGGGNATMMGESSVNHSSLVALNQSIGQQYSNQLESSKGLTNLSSHSGSRFQKRLQNNFMENTNNHQDGHIQQQHNAAAFQRMSTAAINSASAHRQGAKKNSVVNNQHNDGKKSAVQRPGGKTTAATGVSVMQSLINDESILSQHNTSKAINHSSLIVDSAEHNRLIGDTSILSQERYVGSKKTRQTNAMSELRKSSKVPINSKKYAQDQLFGSLMRQASRQKGQPKRVESGRMSSLMRGEATRLSSQSLYNQQRMKQQQQLIHQMDTSLLKSNDQGNILINTSESLVNNNQLIAALKQQSKMKGGTATGGKTKQNNQLNKSLQQQHKKAALNMKQQAALTSGYLSRDQTIDSNPLRSLNNNNSGNNMTHTNMNNKEILSEKKSGISGKDVMAVQSHSNSAILRKSSTALKPSGPSPGYQILSDRDGVVLIQSNVQEEYASAPDLQQSKQMMLQQNQMRIPHEQSSDRMNQSFDISIREENEIVKSCQVSQKWQEQIATKLAAQIYQRIDPLLKKFPDKQHSSMSTAQDEIDYEALFSFTSKSFEVFIETQGEKQANCLNMIKNAYELLLKLSINQMVTQNENLRQQVKQLLLQKTPSSHYTPKGQKKVKGDRYSHDQAHLLQQINEQKMNKGSSSSTATEQQTTKSLKDQKDELARKLDKANRDNVLLMQIIQKNAAAQTSSSLDNASAIEMLNEIARSSMQQPSSQQQTKVVQKLPHQKAGSTSSSHGTSKHQLATQPTQQTVSVAGQGAGALVPQNKGIMPRLNKTTNPSKKQKQTSSSIGGGTANQQAKLASQNASGTNKQLSQNSTGNHQQQNDNHHGPMHSGGKKHQLQQKNVATGTEKGIANNQNIVTTSTIKSKNEQKDSIDNRKEQHLIDQDKSPMMHAVNSSSKPLIPLLNLDKMPQQQQQQVDGAAGPTDAKLEDLIQVDTGKLASPAHGGDAVANEVEYDMSSYASASSNSCRYPPVENNKIDGTGEDQQRRNASANENNNQVEPAAAGLDNQNRDDKLTQSQLLKRMLEAEERDNQRERQREEHAESRDRIDQERINQARQVMAGTPESRGRRGASAEAEDEENDQQAPHQQITDTDDGYVSSSVASSFDYRALTEEEKQRILNGDGPKQPGLGINLAAVQEKKAEGGNADFQDDFMAKYDEFSESWRQACDKMRKL